MAYRADSAFAVGGSTPRRIMAAEHEAPSRPREDHAKTPRDRTAVQRLRETCQRVARRAASRGGERVSQFSNRARARSPSKTREREAPRVLLNHRARSRR